MSARPPTDERLRRYIGRRMTAPEEVRLAAGRVTVFTTPAPLPDRRNEDGALIAELPGKRVVLAIADGAGGLPAGAKASQVALDAFARALFEAVEAAGSGEPAGSGGQGERSKGSDDLRGGVLNGFEAANHAVLGLATGAATTLVACVIDAGRLRAFHVGDSGILVTGLRGKRKLETISHSPVGYAVEAGVISEEEALLHEDRHLVSNLVGAEDMRIEIGPSLRLDRYDTVLLASDGLLDNLTPESIVDTIRKGKLLRASSSLAEACTARMSDDAAPPSKVDDITFLAFRPAPSTIARRRNGT